MNVPPVTHEEVRKRLTGMRMFERFTLRGQPVNMDKTEPLLAVVLVWAGFVFLPGDYTDSSLAKAADRVASMWLWSIVAFAAGGTQVVGITLTWFGVVPPQRRLRMVALAASCWFWASVAWLAWSADSPTGVFLGSIFAVVAALDYGKARVNGRASAKLPQVMAQREEG